MFFCCPDLQEDPSWRPSASICVKAEGRSGTIIIVAINHSGEFISELTTRLEGGEGWHLLLEEDVRTYTNRNVDVALLSDSK